MSSLFVVDRFPRPEDLFRQIREEEACTYIAMFQQRGNVYVSCLSIPGSALLFSVALGVRLVYNPIRKLRLQPGDYILVGQRREGGLEWWLLDRIS